MFKAMNSAASGMEAQELKMDLLANNLANVNTTGYKKARGEFQDLLYETIREVGATSTDGTSVPTGLQVGQGVRAVATLRSFAPGELKQTANPLDIGIEGSGFLQVLQPSGQFYYTRDGSLKTNAQGQLVTSDGQPIEPSIIIPDDTVNITIMRDGTVSVNIQGQVESVQVGQLNLATFPNPAGLKPMGRNLFMQSEASGQPVVAAPGTEGMGLISQSMLESSNVKVVEEMIELIATQRAYETNSKVIQASDEMLRTTANLR